MLPPPQTVEVHHENSVGRPADRTNDRRGSGLFAAACEEIALAMTELATNLIKHAREERSL